MRHVSFLMSAVAALATTAFAADQPGASTPAVKPSLVTDCTDLVADARKTCEAKRESDLRNKAHENATKHALDTPEEKAADKARKNGTDPKKAVDDVKAQNAAPK